MSSLDDQRKLEETINKAKNIKTTYTILRVIGWIIFLAALFIGVSGGSGYDAAYIVAALSFFIELGFMIYGNSQIKKYQAEAIKLLAEISRREVYQPDNRIELASPIGNPSPVTDHPYPQPETAHKYCNVCNNEILPSDMVYDCPKCNFSAHQIHLADWFRTHKECPNCLG